jgi:hypothetical protein
MRWKHSSDGIIGTIGADLGCARLPAAPAARSWAAAGTSCAGGEQAPGDSGNTGPRPVSRLSKLRSLGLSTATRPALKVVAATIGLGSAIAGFTRPYFPPGLPGIVAAIVGLVVVAGFTAVVAESWARLSNRTVTWRHIVPLVAVAILLATLGPWGIGRVLDALDHDLEFAIAGSCDRAGRTLHANSSGFTPGGTYSWRVRNPDGTDYTPSADNEDTVEKDGTVSWTWPCKAADPQGVYTVQLTDWKTGRKTRLVHFKVEMD